MSMDQVQACCIHKSSVLNYIKVDHAGKLYGNNTPYQLLQSELISGSVSQDQCVFPQSVFKGHTEKKTVCSEILTRPFEQQVTAGVTPGDRAASRVMIFVLAKGM